MKLNLEGFTAHICCDGVELETYDVQKEDDKTITCWIASEEGKSFTIHWGDDTAKETLQISAYVDGRQVTRVAHEQKAESACRGSYTLGKTRPFVFSPLVLTDDESLVSSKVDEELGSIRISMKRAQSFVETGALYAGFSVTEIGAVHEKSKKAGVHAVSFGDVKEVPALKSYNAVGLDKEPFVTFKFRYRPIDLLRANGIAPLPPQSAKGKKRSLDVPDDDFGAGPSSKRTREDCLVKPEPDEDDEDDADDDVVFLQEQLAMIQKRLADAQAAKRTKTVVKRETSPIIVPYSISDEVIDLT